MTARTRRLSPRHAAGCLLVFGGAIIYLRYQQTEFTWEAHQLLIRETGILAFGLFCLSWICTPMRRFSIRLGFQPQPIHHWRRIFGLCAATAALCHIFCIYTLHIGQAPLLSAWFQPYAQAGAGAFLLMGFLSLTSFPKVTRALKIHHWKTLHRLVHAIFFLLLFHIVLGPHVQLSYTLPLFAILASISWAGRLNP